MCVLAVRRGTNPEPAENLLGLRQPTIRTCRFANGGNLIRNTSLVPQAALLLQTGHH